MSIALVMPFSHLKLWHLLLLLPLIFPRIKDFSNELAVCIRWSKYWNFSFSISPSNEYSALISFKNEWFYILAVQGTLRNFLQHHSSKASVLWHSAFFIMVQPSLPYMTTGKAIAMTIWTFVGRMMSLLFNTLSRFLITFLPRSNHLLISRMQSPPAVNLEPKTRKSITASTFFPCICYEVMKLDAMILVYNV